MPSQKEAEKKRGHELSSRKPQIKEGTTNITR